MKRFYGSIISLWKEKNNYLEVLSLLWHNDKISTEIIVTFLNFEFSIGFYN